jgi:hypothetical protein
VPFVHILCMCLQLYSRKCSPAGLMADQSAAVNISVPLIIHVG